MLVGPVEKSPSLHGKPGHYAPSSSFMALDTHSFINQKHSKHELVTTDRMKIQDLLDLAESLELSKGILK